MKQTYGIFAVSARAISIKDDKDTGWVADVKWAMTRGAHPERKFELEHMPVLRGSADSDGIKLEVTPRLDGDHLPPIMLPTNQRGNITISDEGDVLVTCRLTFHALETAGLGVDAILNSSCCLECTVDDQPTLEEAIQGELSQSVPKLVSDLQQALNDVAGDGFKVEAFADGVKIGESAPEFTEKPRKASKSRKLDGEGAQA